MPCATWMKGTSLARNTSRVAATLEVRKNSAAKHGCGRAVAGTPGNAVYGATKAFVMSFTQAVHEELKGTGVKCMVLAPSFTRTEFQERAGFDSSEVPSFLWQDAATVVGHSLRAYDKGRAVCVPGPFNAATAAFTAATPQSITRRIAGAIVSRSER